MNQLIYILLYISFGYVGLTGIDPRAHVHGMRLPRRTDSVGAGKLFLRQRAQNAAVLQRGSYIICCICVYCVCTIFGLSLHVHVY